MLTRRRRLNGNDTEIPSRPRPRHNAPNRIRVAQHREPHTFLKRRETERRQLQQKRPIGTLDAANDKRHPNHPTQRHRAQRTRRTLPRTTQVLPPVQPVNAIPNRTCPQENALDLSARTHLQDRKLRLRTSYGRWYHLQILPNAPHGRGRAVKPRTNESVRVNVHINRPRPASDVQLRYPRKPKPTHCTFVHR